ncbi:sigma-70 family RNA polymerase sigma factor [Paenibacillus agilis]|uniref:Sigma-70 family RNA polymerase sigma factor n=2 Tax=Paenibacillus agilis TaxID=3020863 RepID=A0A559IQQ5_9BACL|nr:sigma-70 family RNA polymerase sigma factor [Paenibacillus agilis]
MNIGIKSASISDIQDNTISTEAFTIIYESYYKRVFKYICYRIHNHHAAEDICSHVFEVVVSKYNSFSPEKSNFEVWLFAIARNAVTDYFRVQKRRVSFSLDSIVNMVLQRPSPEDVVIQDDHHQALFASLAMLSDKERHIIAMKYGAGLKNSEIADLLGVSDSNIGVVLYRSLKKLHKVLETEGVYDE